MTYIRPARSSPRWLRRILVCGPLVIIAVVAAGVVSPLPASSTAAAPFPSGTASAVDVGRSAYGGALGEADGAVPDATTVFDDKVPAVAKLRPGLLGALRHAASDAAAERVRFYVTSGWRSRGYEDALRREAIAKYGSEKVASRWVATPATSAHVSGDAADVGPSDAMAWLSKHGATYGLCQIYSNEPWHFELRTEAVGHGCPPMYADPTHDPRMQP